MRRAFDPDFHSNFSLFAVQIVVFKMGGVYPVYLWDKVLVIWECQMKGKDMSKVSNVVRRFLADGTRGERDEIG